LAHSGRRRIVGKRSRGGTSDECMPFLPPEDWHEPVDRDADRAAGGFRTIVQDAGAGYRHVLTAGEIRSRLAELPSGFVAPLQIVQLSRMTKKKQSFPCYGMQWGAAIYLYPIEADRVEEFHRPPKPAVVNETRMYGGRWEQEGNFWRLIWSESAIKDFYLNNILIHELGHLLDERNSSYGDRERFAEWFAVEYGYRRRGSGRPNPDRRTRRRRVVRRHHRH
jgi:hypothetical protein